MSPNTSFAPGQEPDSSLFRRVVGHPRVTYEVQGESDVVGAIRDELLVLRIAREASPALEAALREVAGPGPAGNLGDGIERIPDEAARADPYGPAGVEIWRLRDPDADAIDEARRLRELAEPVQFPGLPGVPAVTPNHICVVSGHNGWCPFGPPRATPVPPHALRSSFVEEQLPGYYHPRVVVIDTGYMHAHPPHEALDARVTSVPGQWFDTHASPPQWRLDPPDEADADRDGRLDDVAGHGTFVAGLVAHQCRQAGIVVVGQRHEVTPLGSLASIANQARLFTTEYALAHTILLHCDADVLQCGFAFPTLSCFPSSAFAAVMTFLAGPAAPRPGVAVVAPAGNEASANEYWPAAHPSVIGVAASNVLQSGRAAFSNWGPWADCCARGEYVLSTYIDWIGQVQGDLPADLEVFSGWARWNGTSFAAPKVSGAIAQVLVDTATTAPAPTLTPVEAAQALLGGAAGVEVTQLLGLVGVTLPQLHLG